MSYVHPVWLEGQRQRWQRPDVHRFVKPEPIRRMSYAERLVEQRRTHEEEALAAAEHEALRESLLSLRRQLAEVKFELAFRRIFHKYDPHQPRVPMGSPDGGQWRNGDAESDDESNDTGATLDDLGPSEATDLSSSGRGGHHYLPRGIYNKRSLSDETRRVFEDGTTGKLDDKRLNLFTGPHRNYNDATNELFDKFLATNGITEEQMTPRQAQELLGEIITSKDPRILRFNMRIWMRQLFRGGGFRGNE